MPNENIMGIPTKACVNGITKDDALKIKKIPEIDERVTALEQGGSDSEHYQSVIYSYNNNAYNDNNIDGEFLKKFKYYIPDSKLNEILSILRENNRYEDELFELELEFDPQIPEPNLKGRIKKDILRENNRYEDEPNLKGRIKKDILICINFDLFPNSQYIYNNCGLSVVIKKDSHPFYLFNTSIGSFDYSIGSSNAVNNKNIKLNNINVSAFNHYFVYSDIVSQVQTGNSASGFVWAFISSQNKDIELININQNHDENFGILIMDNLYESGEYD